MAWIQPGPRSGRDEHAADDGYRTVGEVGGQVPSGGPPQRKRCAWRPRRWDTVDVRSGRGAWRKIATNPRVWIGTSSRANISVLSSHAHAAVADDVHVDLRLRRLAGVPSVISSVSRPATAPSRRAVARIVGEQSICNRKVETIRNAVVRWHFHSFSR